MLVENADLPLLAHDDPAFAGERFHEVLDDLASRSWLVRSDLGYLVLGREPGMALLKDRRLSFPAVELLELQGLTGGIIYDGTTKGLMAQSGPPHARLRRLVSAAFTPRRSSINTRSACNSTARVIASVSPAPRPATRSGPLVW